MWFLPYWRKSDISDIYEALIRRLDKEFPGRIKAMRTDNGGEVVNKCFAAFLKSKGIKHQKSIPYEHEMNGRAENNNRIIVEAIRSVLQGSGLPNSYWTFVVGQCVT